MELPYDNWSVAAILIAGALLAGATRRAWPTAGRLACIVAAALIIRLDPAWQSSLHTWDESIHAVVAKRLAADPLTPVLYEHTPLPPPIDDWTEAGIWLHKPPLALWLMAGSLATFGTDALSLRLPSLVLSTLGVWLTFAIGRRAFDVRVGLLAAAFQAVNGLLVALSSGRRVADHVDTTLIFCVQLGAFAALSTLDGRRTRGAWLAGGAMGLGILAKSAPALVILPVAAAGWWLAIGWMATTSLIWRLLVACAAVAGPWIIYTHVAWPDAAREADAYTLTHITQVVEMHGGSMLSYVEAMPHFFGELVYFPVAWFLVAAITRGATGHRMIAVWLIVPYAVFSLMATKLSGFIAIAAPAVFLAEAAAWIRLRELVTVKNALSRVTIWTMLTLLALLPSRYLLEPTGAFERRNRNPPLTDQFREITRLTGVERAIIYNVPRPYELMFYSSSVAYGRMPRQDEVSALRARGLPFFIFQPAGTIVVAPEGGQIIEGR
jgi:4-amino-4-deoxy-L-arabinose transferase